MRQVVESAVTIPLEQQINGVEGMHYMTSTSANDGTSSIRVTFQTDTTWTLRRSTYKIASSYCTGPAPSAIKSTGITISKANSNFVFAAGFLFARWKYSDQYI